MQTPSSLLVPQRRDQAVSLGQNDTELRTVHGQQKYEKIFLSLEDEKELGDLPGSCRYSCSATESWACGQGTAGNWQVVKTPR